MLKRLKQSLIESYVGAIALGYLLAQTILYFMNIFAAPIAGWISRKQFGGLAPRDAHLPGFSLADALPDLARFVVLLLVWYVLVRWLYFKAAEKDGAAANTE